MAVRDSGSAIEFLQKTSALTVYIRPCANQYNRGVLTPRVNRSFASDKLPPPLIDISMIDIYANDCALIILD